jgi:hypothetical protein
MMTPEQKAAHNARCRKWQTENREHVRQKARENYAKRQALKKQSAGA